MIFDYTMMRLPCGWQSVVINPTNYIYQARRYSFNQTTRTHWWLLGAFGNCYLWDYQ
jgi:hypothetical protein